MKERLVERHNQFYELKRQKREAFLDGLKAQHPLMVEQVSKELHRKKFYRRQNEDYDSHVSRAVLVKYHRWLGGVIATARKQLEFIEP